MATRMVIKCHCDQRLLKVAPSNRTPKKRNKRALECSWPIGALREDAQDARNEGPGAFQGGLSAFAKREITHPSGFCGFVVGKQVKAAPSNKADKMLNTTAFESTWPIGAPPEKAPHRPIPPGTVATSSFARKGPEGASLIN